MLDLVLSNYITFMAVFARMTGMIVFNPIWGRRNVPVIVKMGLAILISLIVMGVLPAGTSIYLSNPFILLFICLKELFIGFIVGFIIQMFLSALLMAGEFADLQLGVGMASIYDPQSNISMSMVGSLFNIFYIALFFISNAHLNFFKIMVFSFDILPLGTALLNPQCGQYIALLFANVLVLAVKLSLPIVAIEIITEIGLGVLMRAVPQINMFVVGLQLKLLVGIILIVLVFPSLFGFFDSMTDTMFDSIQKGLSLMS